MHQDERIAGSTRWGTLPLSFPNLDGHRKAYVTQKNTLQDLHTDAHRTLMCDECVFVSGVCAREIAPVCADAQSNRTTAI